MKPEKLKKFLILLFLLPFSITILGTGCEKDDDWITINPIDGIDQSLQNHLDYVFPLLAWTPTGDDCRVGFDADTVLYVISTQEEYDEIDLCPSDSKIDFDQYTLLVGKIQTSMIEDRLESVKLICNDSDSKYRVDAEIKKTEYGYTAHGNIFFWKLFQKLNTNYSIKLNVIQN